MSKNKQKSRRDTLRITTYICICIEIYLVWLENLSIILRPTNCTKLRYYNNDKKEKEISIAWCLWQVTVCNLVSKLVILSKPTLISNHRRKTKQAYQFEWQTMACWCCPCGPPCYITGHQFVSQHKEVSRCFTRDDAVAIATSYVDSLREPPKLCLNTPWLLQLLHNSKSPAVTTQNDQIPVDAVSNALNWRKTKQSRGSRAALLW